MTIHEDCCIYLVICADCLSRLQITSWKLHKINFFCPVNVLWTLHGNFLSHLSHNSVRWLILITCHRSYIKENASWRRPHIVGFVFFIYTNMTSGLRRWLLISTLLLTVLRQRILRRVVNCNRSQAVVLLYITIL